MYHFDLLHLPFAGHISLPLPAHHAAVIIGFRGGHEGVGPGDKESRANTIKSGRDKTMFAPSFFVQKN